MKLIKTLVTGIFFILFLFFTANALATSGCCSWHGGQSYCDYSTGRWVCSDGTYSPSCTCGGVGTYNPPPSCPFMAYYDSLSGSCKCMSGYVASGTSCISNLQYCWNTLGYSSTYNYGTGQCECSSGYVFSNGSCISGLTYCMNNYGIFSQYDYLSGKCRCMTGYQFNSSGTKCISQDEACQNQLGIMSRYDSLSDTCDCLSGYVIKYGQCSLKQIPIRNIVVPQISSDTPTPTPTSIFENLILRNTPTPKPQVKKIAIPTITIEASNSSIIATTTPTTYKDFNKNQSLLDKIISFIARLFGR